MVGATAHIAEVARAATTVIRKARRAPAPSMNGPTASTATAAATSSEVTTQGSSVTRPRSSPMAGSAAVTDRWL